MSVDWSRLLHAYGPASDIPSLLAMLSTDPRDPVWGELWSRLCHQGTVYTASFAVIPQLVETASQWKPRDRPMILVLASNILAGATDQQEFRTDRAALAGPITTLSLLADETLDVPDLSTEDFVYVLQACLSLRGLHPWASQLEGLLHEEFEAVCPRCDTALLVVAGSCGFFVSSEDYIGERRPKKSPIDPAVPAQLTGTPAWIYSELNRAGHRDLAGRAIHVFGSSTCTVCEARFEIPEGISIALSSPKAPKAPGLRGTGEKVIHTRTGHAQRRWWQFWK